MHKRHMAEFTAYEFRPVGGRVCKETDSAVVKVPGWDRAPWKGKEKFNISHTNTDIYVYRIHYHCTPLSR